LAKYDALLLEESKIEKQNEVEKSKTTSKKAKESEE
jgi:hypothetical protein